MRIRYQRCGRKRTGITAANTWSVVTYIFLSNAEHEKKRNNSPSYLITIYHSNVIIYEPNTCRCILLAFAPDYMLRDSKHLYDFHRLCTTYMSIIIIPLFFFFLYTSRTRQTQTSQTNTQTQKRAYALTTCREIHTHS